MPPYNIQGEGTRVLTVLTARSLSFRFYHKDGKEQVRFRQAGPRLIAAVTGSVMVYKKPNAMQYHKELMQHNARAMWLGLESDPSRLIDNLLEYVETI
jgi:hypothetical protein